MEQTVQSKLVGDIKTSIAADSHAHFLVELEILMLRYKIDKIDVSWKKFGSEETVI